LGLASGTWDMRNSGEMVLEGSTDAAAAKATLLAPPTASRGLGGVEGLEKTGDEGVLVLVWVRVTEGLIVIAVPGWVPAGGERRVWFNHSGA
jgi:hypothetical protein